MPRERVNVEDVNLLAPVNWFLHHVGLPGPTDVLPSPREVLDALGVPSLDAIAENLKANALANLRSGGLPFRGRLPFTGGR